MSLGANALQTRWWDTWIPQCDSTKPQKANVSIWLSLSVFFKIFFTPYCCKVQLWVCLSQTVKCTLPFLFIVIVNDMSKCWRFHLHILSCFLLFACLLPNEALRIKCLKDCRHFTRVVWLFKDMPQYTASWNAAHLSDVWGAFWCKERERKTKISNPATLCKWDCLAFCRVPVFIMPQRSNSLQIIAKLCFHE